MKKPLALYLALLLGSFGGMAQNGNSGFIDSPSWVLAQKGTRNGGAEASGQALAVDTKTTSRPQPAGTVRTAPAPLSNREEKSSDKKVKADGPKRNGKGEGFFHIGIYVAPVLNWTSSVTGPYKRSGVTACGVPTVMLDFRIIRRFYVGAGVSLNTYGGKVKYTGQTLADGMAVSDYERTYTFSYIDIPVRLKLQTPNFAGSRSSMFFSAGLNFGFGVSYKYKDSYKGTVDGIGGGTFEQEGRMKKDSKAADISAVGQIGVNVQLLKRLNVVVGVEYHYGMIKPLKNNSTIIQNSYPGFNNQQLGLVVGVMF